MRTRGTMTGNDYPVIGITAVKIDGTERYRLCVPRDGIGFHLSRGQLEDLARLIPEAKAKMDAVPDDGPHRVVRNVRAE